MKKLMLLAGLYCLQPTLHAGSLGSPGINNKAPINASDRALRHFKANYADVQNVAWYNSKNGEIYCVFHQNGVSNRIFYDNRGYWKYSMMGYPASHLDPVVKDMALSFVKGYHISYVYEIRSDRSEPVYMINMEDEDNIKIIQVTGDEIVVKQALKKR
jgi:hypothetical protein